MERRPTPWRPVEIEQRLAARLGYRAVLAVSEAAQPASVLPLAGALCVRVAPTLLHAPEAVLDALARFAHAPGDLDARSSLAFTDARPVVEEEDPLDATQGRLPRPRGDLHRHQRALLRGRRRRADRVEPRLRRAPAALDPLRQLPPPAGETVGQIKIHPALDQDWVPRGFVEFVVHHECLHAVVPTRCIDGRRAFHPPEFRRRERLYPEFQRWRRWEKENLGRFLGRVNVRAST